MSILEMLYIQYVIGIPLLLYKFMDVLFEMSMSINTLCTSYLIFLMT